MTLTPSTPFVRIFGFRGTPKTRKKTAKNRENTTHHNKPCQTHVVLFSLRHVFAGRIASCACLRQARVKSGSIPCKPCTILPVLRFYRYLLPKPRTLNTRPQTLNTYTVSVVQTPVTEPQAANQR